MKRYTKGIISGMLVMTLCLGSVQIAGATTIDEAQKKAEALEAQKDAAKAKQSALNNQLNQIIGDMDATQKKLEKKNEEIQLAEEELVQAKIEENTQYQDMKLRIKFMYEHGDATIFEILTSSESITDFLNKADYVKQLSEYDRKMLEEFQKIVKTVEEKEKQLQAEYEELSVIRDDLIEQQGTVETLLAENQLQISDLESQIGENAALLQSLIQKAEEEKRIREQQQAAAEAEKNNQKNNSTGNTNNSQSTSNSGNTSNSGSTSNSGNTSNSGSTNNTGSTNNGGGTSTGGSTSSSGSTSSGGNVVGATGTFTNPCPGAFVSSTFGYRTFDNSFHKGLDLAAGEGTPTYAADGGMVIIAGWSNSAGNWVVIDHGNGFVTKYMHHSALYVSAGQYVSRGQQIGAVGNTGYSAGAHLHFQVELNGSPVDPQAYL